MSTALALDTDAPRMEGFFSLQCVTGESISVQKFMGKKRGRKAPKFGDATCVRRLFSCGEIHH